MTPNQRGFATIAAKVSRGEKTTPIIRAARPGSGLFCTLSGTDATSVTEMPLKWMSDLAARPGGLALRGQHKLLIRKFLASVPSILSHDRPLCGNAQISRPIH